MVIHDSRQPDLFSGPAVLLDGFGYEEGFLDRQEEAELVKRIETLTLQPARYKQYRARREVVSFGWAYDYERNERIAASPEPDFLGALRERAAAWAALPAADFAQTLVARYRPGTPLGWHRDVPDYEVVVGVSLLSGCTLRFRRYPPERNRGQRPISLWLEPRSIYVIRGAARWEWQHGLPAVASLRYSISFRTLRRAGHAA